MQFASVETGNESLSTNHNFFCGWLNMQLNFKTTKYVGSSRNLNGLATENCPKSQLHRICNIRQRISGKTIVAIPKLLKIRLCVCNLTPQSSKRLFRVIKHVKISKGNYSDSNIMLLYYTDNQETTL